jgi:DNA-binding SARP family transcriptional activator/Tfp pilus assembly protein PilF
MLEIRNGTGDRVAITGRKQRTLLAALLARPTEWVSSRWLIEVLWGAEPPRSALANLKTFVWELRQVLPPLAGGGERIEGRRGEYRIIASTDDLDLLTYAELVRQGRRAIAHGDLGAAADLLTRAIDLWRGDFAEGLDESPALVPLRSRMVEEHWSLVEEWGDLQLKVNRHVEAAQELRGLVAKQPLRERLWYQLIVALYRSGRRAESLAAYREVYDVLQRELGIEPGPELRRLHGDVLRDDPALRPPEVPAGTPPPVGSAQLPADLISFTGRAQDVDEVISCCLPDGQVRSAVCAIDGMAGVGKTTLAVHVAHRLLPEYPDGQLFLDLHGFTDGVEPVDPAQALGRLLRALGVPGDQIPRDPEDRSAMYRNALAGRRILILLDNAADETQVAPLLPADPGCLVLVTGRRRLTGLDDVRTVSLDVMPPSDGLALFTRVVGDSRVALETAAAGDVVQRCGHLPLAIRIAALRLKARPTWTVAHLAERLRDQHGRLIELEAGQRSVTAALRVSYEHLSQTQKGMFRLLGLHPGVDIDTGAAAALADLPVWQTDQLLESLVDLHLLLPAGERRYQFHDLVRQHARSLALAGEAHATQQAAIRRLLDHWMLGASAAFDLMRPGEADPEVCPSGPAPIRLDTVDAAMSWLEAERRNLLAGVCYAAEHDLHLYALRLARPLTYYFVVRGYRDEWLAVQQLAVAAARQVGDRRGLVHAVCDLSVLHLRLGDYRAAAVCLAEASALARDLDGLLRAHVLSSLVLVYLRIGRYSEALSRQRQALKLCEKHGDVAGEARCHTMLGMAYLCTGDYPAAIRHADRAVALYATLQYDHQRADAINVAGLVHMRLGQYQLALSRGQESLELYTAIGSHLGRAYALNLLGSAYDGLGRHTEAMRCLGVALSLSRQLDDKNTEAHTLNRMGVVERATGRYQQALDCQLAAVALVRRCDDQALECGILNETARTYLIVGQPDTALDHSQRALKNAEVVGDPYELARAHHGVAQALTALGENDAAAEHWDEAVAGYATLGVPEAAAIAVPRPRSGRPPERHPNAARDRRLARSVARARTP